MLRRLVVIATLLLLPPYLLSLAESLEVPPAWRAIAPGDSHAQVRAQLRRSGLADHQCEWLDARLTVRCTLAGRHHAAGLVIAFDAAGRSGRVAGVRIHEPRYTGPFHLHARLRALLR